jgi:predicted PurR-regulated permease PerM
MTAALCSLLNWVALWVVVAVAVVSLTARYVVLPWLYRRRQRRKHGVGGGPYRK